MSVRHGEAASHCLQTANADLLQLCRFRRSPVPVAPYFTATWVEEACFQKATTAEGFQGEVTLHLHTAWFARRFGPWNSRMGPSSFSDGWSAAVLSGRIFQQRICSGFREVWFRCSIHCWNIRPDKTAALQPSLVKFPPSHFGLLEVASNRMFQAQFAFRPFIALICRCQIDMEKTNPICWDNQQNQWDLRVANFQISRENDRFICCKNRSIIS